MFHQEEYQLHRYLSILGFEPHYKGRVLRKRVEYDHCMNRPYGYVNAINSSNRILQLNIQREARQLWENITRSPCNYTVMLRKVDAIKQNTLYEILERKPFNLTKNFTDNHICSKGGAVFQIIIHGPNTRSICHTRDMFNGTYWISCFVHENGGKIEVSLLSVQFSAYAKVILRNDILFSIPMPHFLRPNYSLATAHIEKKCPLERGIAEVIKCQAPQVIWHRIANNNYGMRVKGVHWNLLNRKPPLKGNDLSKCLRYYENIMFIGDSNMRYIFYYLLHKMGKLDRHLPKKLRKTYMKENLTFIWAPLAKHITRILRDISHPNSTTAKPKLIIINCGFWQWSDILGFVTQMEGVFNEVEVLKGQHYISLRVIWVGMTPFPGYPSFAINSWVFQRMTELGVEVFDIASLIYPFNYQLVCGPHYICIIPQTQIVYGTVGIVAVEEFYEHICCSCLHEDKAQRYLAEETT